LASLAFLGGDFTFGGEKYIISRFSDCLTYKVPTGTKSQALPLGWADFPIPPKLSSLGTLESHRTTM